ncbi:MAG: serine--tRNA ligase [bacterium]
MLDREFIIANRSIIEKTCSVKKTKIDIDKLYSLIDARKQSVNKLNQYREEKNKLTEEVPKIKKQGGDVKPLLDKSKEISLLIGESEKVLETAENEMNIIMSWMPNILEADVPSGENAVYKTIRERGDFSEKTKNYYDICTENNYIDFKRGAKIAASSFPLYMGKGALLERTLINFMLDLHIEKHGYLEVFPPFMVNYNSLYSTGQLPKMEEDMYGLDKGDAMFLIPTAEVPVTNIYNDEIVPEKDLPKKFVAYSACFRREAGSYGKDTKGLKRLHQFNKVELVRYSLPDESRKAHEEMLEEAERVLKLLDLSYRVILLPDNDTSFSSAKTYDIEVWAEASKEFLEVSSVSNFLDFQARRANIRYKNREGRNAFIHTLNGSGLATPRTVIAIIEHYQTADNDFEFPPILKDYMKHGKEIFS